MPNLASYQLNGTIVAARAAETWLNDPDFAGGMNKGGSNAPIIGLSTNVPDPKSTDWPRVNQTAAQLSQHIGGVPDVDGDVGAAGFAVQVVFGADVNERSAFVSADQSTAVGAVLDATTGAVNRSDATVASGAFIWGVIPVA
jgi:hypothetical protein